MAKTGAERVQAHRVRLRAELDRLRAEVQQLQEANERLTHESLADLTKTFELAQQLENLKTYNKGLRTRNARLTIWLDYYDVTIGEDGQQVVQGRFTADQWDRLRAMDDAQLRQWVKVGKAMADKDEVDAVDIAILWVEGNRIELQSKGGDDART